MRPARRLALVAGSTGILLGACSSSPPARVSGLTGLGATTRNWNAVHQATSPNGSDYGPTVNTGVGSRSTYTSVTVSSGHVSGWVMSFRKGSTLAAAEHLLGHDLPGDAQQISSSRQTGSSPGYVCEVVSYQSLQLRLASPNDPNLSSGRFSVSYFEVQLNGQIASSYAHVNRAVVGSPVPPSTPTCP